MKLTKEKVKKAGVTVGAGLGAAGATQALLSKSPINRKSVLGLGTTAAAGVVGSVIAKKLQNRKKAKFSSNELTTFGNFTVNASFPTTETIKETKPKTAIELAYEKIRNKNKLSNEL